ncbi:hypothetical protein AQUCO_00201160v1 [Aquilegia coerulea]|uniref:ATP-dependent Clp protease proteolytic subunit n=1 Tax=Aquilegia coerulea TaxID=218851 RepID=A0A2G5F6H6_AQUCA|nr:hypothetical protein AQUCO_00201160v1 [Aquilegia coerulea]
MERSLTFTTSSPSSFFSNGIITQFPLKPSISPTSFKRKPISIKAIKSTRKTLSADWNLANSSPKRRPRFEELDITNMLLRQRIVFLGSPVDDATADFIISQLLFLDAEDSTKDIKLFILSPGGSVTAAMGIYDAMKMCKADVSTVCLGLAASISAFLLATGSKGKRFCMPNARVMIHQPHGSAGGDIIDFGIQTKEWIYQKTKMTKILSRVTGKPEQQIDWDTGYDYFMNPWEAKEYGLVDVVIDDGKPGLIAPIADARPPPQPSIWYQWKIVESGVEEEMPCEERLIGYKGGQGSDEERGKEQEREAAAPV